MAKQTTAKTPTVAIARVLRGLGLKQGLDFTVRGSYINGERIGTTAHLFSQHVRTLVADHADEIEAAVQLDGGFVFNVSIRYYDSRPWPTVANYGARNRETAPVATVPMKVKLGNPRPAFHQPHPAAQAAAAASRDAHPYEGLAQRPFSSLTWACEEAGQVWFFQNTSSSPRHTLRRQNSPVRVNGWYLYSPGQDRARFLGATLTIAATAAEDLVLAHDKLAEETGAVGGTDPVGLKVDRTRAAWPKGTRVTGRDTQGKLRNGTVNGRDVGVVTYDGHKNFGRAYVGVTWDSDRPSYADHERPFADALTRISTTR